MLTARPNKAARFWDCLFARLVRLFFSTPRIPMTPPGRASVLIIAILAAGLLSACKTTDKKDARKEVEGVDYILVHDTGSLMPRKVRTKTDVLNSHKKNGDLRELETASGAGSRAPSN
jgi:hypothetical protein